MAKNKTGNTKWKWMLIAIVAIILVSIVQIIANNNDTTTDANIREAEKSVIQKENTTEPEVGIYVKSEKVFFERISKQLRPYYSANFDSLTNINDDLSKWLYTDTCTFYSNLPYLTDSLNLLTIAASGDGNVRIYSWDTHLGGTMKRWDNVIQYRSNGKVKTFDGSPWNIKVTQGTDTDEIDFGCHVNAVYDFKRNDGQTVYVSETYFKTSSYWGFTSLHAFCISDGKLKEIDDAFVTPNNDSQISTEYIIPDWYFLTNGKGWDWIFSLDRNTQTFYVPVENDSKLTDQYDLYKFNGTKFVYAGRDGGFWLHPSLRKFERLEMLAQAGKFLIRIDRVSSGVFRYSSWSDTEDMTKKPDIIIENGIYDEEKNEYRFINGNFTYHIKSDSGKIELVIKHSNNVIITAK